MPVNQDRLVQTFVTLVSLDSPSGQEQQVAAYCKGRLQELGFEAELDHVGNVVARMDGMGASASGEVIMLNAHMDGVQPCIGIKPQIGADGVIRSDGTTILGADDRAGVATILEAVTVAHEQGNHLPLEIVLTVQEETHLGGAIALDYSKIKSKTVIAMDSHGPIGSLVYAAPYFNAVNATIHGVAAHAGVAPEEGVSAIIAAADAIMNMPLGRIDEETTANIGVISGGLATNIIPAEVSLKGEARSLVESKLEAQTEQMREAIRRAADTRGIHADVTTSREFYGYKLDESDPILGRVMRAMQAMGIKPILERSGGGSDVNIFRGNGLYAINLSAGPYDIHTTHEYVKIADLEQSANLLLSLVQGAGVE